LQQCSPIFNMPNTTSQHILNTAANLLGFCLFVITSLHITDKAENSIIDELTSGIAILLTVSCLFSFFSIRSTKPMVERRFETIADYLFIISLLGILIIISLITLNYIKWCSKIFFLLVKNLFIFKKPIALPQNKLLWKRYCLHPLWACFLYAHFYFFLLTIQESTLTQVPPSISSG